MPAMKDPYFAKSVTYICEHNQDGAMGVVINRPIDMTLDQLFEQISLEINTSPLATKPVLFGGPVQVDRGFVLHQPAGDWDSTIAVIGDTALTTSKDILEAVAAGQGPDKILIALGYAGWSAGQLEQELGLNAWLTVKPETMFDQDKVIFDTPNEAKFDAAISLLGVSMDQLSEIAGHA